MRFVAVLLVALGACTLGACTPSSGAPSDAGAPDRADLVNAPKEGARIYQLSQGAMVESEVVPYVDRRPQPVIDYDACSGFDGQWRCKKPKAPRAHAMSASSPVFPPAWGISAWYVASTGSDTNPCTTSALPCATFGEIIVHRFGTQSPTLPQFTAFYLLTPQIKSIDTIFFTPNYASIYDASADVTTVGGAALFVTPQTVTTFEAGVVTQPVVVEGGTLLTVTGMPDGSAPGQLLENTTAAGGPSYAYILSVDGGAGSATVEQPLNFQPPSTAIGVNNSWAQGDTIVLENPSLTNVGEWAGHGNGGTTAIGLAQISDYQFTSYAGLSLLILSEVSENLTLRGGSGAGAYAEGTDVTGIVSAVSGTTGFIAGASRSEFVCKGGQTVVATQAILLPSSTVSASTIGCTAVYSGVYMGAGQFNVEENGTAVVGANPAYGLYSMNANSGGNFYNPFGPTNWASLLLTTGALSFGGGGTGTGNSFNQTTGTFGAGQPLTIAALTDAGTLLNPNAVSGYIAQ